MAQAPAINQLTKGAAGFTQALIDQARGVWLLTGAAAPTDGASGTGAGFAAPGSLYIRCDGTSSKIFIQTAATKASVTWVAVGGQS